MNQWSPEELAAIDQIEAMEAQEAEAAKPGMVGNAMNELGNQIRSAGKTLGFDALNGYVDQRLQDYNAPARQPSMLPSSEEMYAQGSELGKTLMKEEPQAPPAAAPKAPAQPKAVALQETEVINGVTYKLQNGKYVRVK